MKFIFKILILVFICTICLDCLKLNKVEGDTTTGTTTTASTTSTTTTGATTASSTYDFNSSCTSTKYKNESAILFADCKLSTGITASLKFNLNQCIDYRDNKLSKATTGGPGFKKCSCIIMPKLVCNCKNKGEISGTSFPSIDLSLYVTVISDQPYCKTT
jgi:hypothetical protein